MDNSQFEERQIDLLDIIWRLAEQWRGVLLTGIVFAVIASVFLLSRDTKVEADTTVSSEQIKAEEQYRKSSEALYRYANYMWQKKNYETSFWNTNDYKDAVVDTCIFRFGPKESSTDILAQTAVYASMADDDDFNDALLSEAGNLWKDINRTSLYQIMTLEIAPDMFSDDYSVNSEKTGVIKITMLLPGMDDASGWEATVCDAVNKYYSDQNGISDTAPPELVYHGANRIEYIDLSKKSDDLYSGAAVAHSGYNTVYNTLDSDAKDTVSQIIDEAGGSVDVSDYIALLDERLAIDLGAQGNNNEAKNSNKTVMYALLGFIAGCIAYAGIYAMIIILNGTVISENDIKRVSDISSFGGIYEYPYRRTLELFLHDKKIYRYRTRNGKTIRRITDDVTTRLKHHGSNKLTIVSLGEMTDREKAATEEQLDILKGNQIEATHVNIESSICDIEESLFTDIERVLIVVIGCRTKWGCLSDLYQKFSKYNISIIGSEFIDV